MKKIILALAVILTAGLTSAFANEDINENAVASFRKDFVAARNVSWQQSRNYIKATFDLNNQVMYAFYNYRGELMAVIHHILSNELPGDLKSALKKGYRGYWVSDLFELSSDEQHLYYVTLENADATIVLKSDGSGGWKFYKKLK
ncbi:MAG TPA: hypothetical protein VK543_13425 [Puia sp.]|nr:hypothetical protein [Puia sp.]